MMAFICCSAVSGSLLNVSIDPGELAPFVIPGASAGIIWTVRAGWVATLAAPISSFFSSHGVGVADTVADPARSAHAADAAHAAGAARAAPRLEASGFVGYSTFGDSELGNSWAPEQVPRSSA